MIIWSGFGFLVAIIGFAALVLTEWIAEAMTNNGQFYQQNLSLTLNGTVVWTAVLQRLLPLRKPRTVIDKKAGAEIELRKNNPLFFIPVK